MGQAGAAATKQLLPLAVLQYHGAAVQALAFSEPPGSLLVSVGRDPDRAVVLWDYVRQQVRRLGEGGRTRDRGMRGGEGNEGKWG